MEHIILFLSRLIVSALGTEKDSGTSSFESIMKRAKYATLVSNQRFINVYLDTLLFYAHISSSSHSSSFSSTSSLVSSSNANSDELILDPFDYTTESESLPFKMNTITLESSTISNTNSNHNYESPPVSPMNSHLDIVEEKKMNDSSPSFSGEPHNSSISLVSPPSTPISKTFKKPQLPLIDPQEEAAKIVDLICDFLTKCCVTLPLEDLSKGLYSSFLFFYLFFSC